MNTKRFYPEKSTNRLSMQQTDANLTSVHLRVICLVTTSIIIVNKQAIICGRQSTPTRRRINERLPSPTDDGVRVIRWLACEITLIGHYGRLTSATLGLSYDHSTKQDLKYLKCCINAHVRAFQVFINKAYSNGWDSGVLN